MSHPGTTMTGMRDRWHRTPVGYALNPPETCPACAWGWPTTGRGRPAERPIRCTCPTALRGGHRAWACPVCAALVAEGCTDTCRWVQGAYPGNLEPEARFGVPPELMDEAIQGWPDG